MRIDLPGCGFKDCKYNFDCNCKDRNKYEKCEYKSLHNTIPYDCDYNRIKELIKADKDGRCIILGTKNKESEVICELVKTLDWVVKSVKNHDFSPFRIVTGAPENTYPVIREFNKILDKYDETIYTAFKNIEVLSSTESEK